MQAAKNPIVDMYQTQLEASRRLADVMFLGTERIDHVFLEATHRAVTDQLALAQAMASAPDPKGVANLQASYLSHRPDNAVNYQQEIVRILTEIQNEVGKSIQYYMEHVGSTMSHSSAGAANAANSASAPSAVHSRDGAFNPVTGMFSVWETAFREAASMANRNMAAARSTFEKMAATTADAAQRTGAASHGAEAGARTSRTANATEAHHERKGHSSGKRASR